MCEILSDRVNLPWPSRKRPAVRDPLAGHAGTRQFCVEQPFELPMSLLAALFMTLEVFGRSQRKDASQMRTEALREVQGEFET